MRSILRSRNKEITQYNIMNLPSINSTTKILSFDLEANGLHGQAFAVGAAIVCADGQIIDQYTARVTVHDEIDEWVKDNVLGSIEGMAETHADYQSFCNDFWTWFVAAQEKADYVVVQNGYPVEYSFLNDCQKMNLEERYWQHPFPILDVTSMMVQAGYDASAKVRMEGRLIKELGLCKHHPLDDARLAAQIVFELSHQ